MTDGTTRLFVAIDPPDTARKKIGRIAQDLAGARWTREEQLHVTLRFLGTVPASDAPSIADALDGAAVPPFSLTAEGFGVFPSFRAPRVLWVGLSPAAPIAALHAEIESRLGTLSAVEADEKPFSPHLTLARLTRTPPAAVREWMGARERFAEGPWSVEAFFLYASTLTPGGAIHRRLREYALTPAGEERRAAR